MRKSKDIKRKRNLAAIEYRRGNKKDAYKMWTEATNELRALRGKNKPVAAPAEPTANEGAAS